MLQLSQRARLFPGGTGGGRIAELLFGLGDGVPIAGLELPVVASQGLDLAARLAAWTNCPCCKRTVARRCHSRGFCGSRRRARSRTAAAFSRLPARTRWSAVSSRATTAALGGGTDSLARWSCCGAGCGTPGGRTGGAVSSLCSVGLGSWRGGVGTVRPCAGAGSCTRAWCRPAHPDSCSRAMATPPIATRRTARFIENAFATTPRGCLSALASVAQPPPPAAAHRRGPIPGAPCP
jgi:hypothetical protein